jgi:hypothetical protein
MTPKQRPAVFKWAALPAMILLFSVLPGMTSTVANPPEGEIDPAECADYSMAETGLQGQVSRADRDSGRSLQGYWCNMSLIGKYQGHGAGIINPSYKNCAYFGSFFPNSLMGDKNGVQVVDASDTANPKGVNKLTSTAMSLGTWESLKVDPVHGRLAAVGVPLLFGFMTFDIYDIKDDCTKPKLLNGTGDSNDTPSLAVAGHEGGFSPDGNTYYATDVLGDLTAIDISDPTKPETIYMNFTGLTSHGFSISPDGNTMYLARIFPAGVRVLDISDIQQRRPNPQVRIVGAEYWYDGLISQTSVNFVKDGHKYLFAVDEGGSGGVRLLDVADRTKPQVIRKYRLEINRPENGPIRKVDVKGNGAFGYDAHYCSIDSPVDPTMLACSYWASGVRLFDITDLMNPKELGYFNPPGQTPLLSQGKLPNSPHSLGTLLPPFTNPMDVDFEDLFTQPDGSVDWCSSPPEFRSGNQLWVSCSDNGFMVLQYDAPSAAGSTSTALPAPTSTVAGPGKAGQKVTKKVTKKKATKKKTQKKKKAAKKRRANAKKKHARHSTITKKAAGR